MPEPTTMPELLERLAEREPNGLALTFGDQQLTFADLRDRSTAVAAGLHEAGVRAGDAVAVWLPNCVAWVELQFALARLGGLLVCVNTRYRSHELGAVLAQSRARWLVMQPEFRGIDFVALMAATDDDQRSALEGVVLLGADAGATLSGHRCLAYEDLRDASGTAPDAAGPDRPCVAFASSGSTGVPKLVVHDHRGIVEHARAVADRFYDEPGAAALVTLPLSGVFGYVTFMGALAGGRPSVVMESFDANLAVELIERHRVTTVTGPDEVMLRIIEAAQPADRLASWREGGFGAQSVDSTSLIRRGDEIGVRLFQCYGSSECLGLTSRQPRHATPAERTLGGGLPVSPHTEIRVRSPETDEPVEIGEPGLLEIRGPSVMSGYLHQPDATAAAFTGDGWFRTGDIGYLVGEENRFVFLTRANDALRLAGFLVEPRELEQFIERLDVVAAAQVVEVRTDRGARAAAFVIPEAGATVGERDVIEHCAASLAKYKVPARVFVVESFPTTPSANGDKVQRGRLRELAQTLLADTAKA